MSRESKKEKYRSKQKKIVRLINRHKTLRDTPHQEVPLEHPYFDGYYFNIVVKPEVMNSSPEKKKKELSFALKYTYTKIFKEKNPPWFKEYSPEEDNVFELTKGIPHKVSGFFYHILKSQYEKNVPDEYKHIFNIVTASSYLGVPRDEYVIDPLIRHNFRIMRRKRYVTHRTLVDGEIESEKSKISNILWTQKEEVRFGPKSYPNRKRYKQELKRIREKSYIPDDNLNL